MAEKRRITENVFWVGADDRRIDLFENLFPLTGGISYNSYLIAGEKTALVDTADAAVSALFLERLESALGGRPLDYLIIEHLEPDHAANIRAVLDRYPSARAVVNAKTTVILERYFGAGYGDRCLVVKEGDALDLGDRTLRFYMAPMIHWPEVMIVHDEKDKLLFSADAFGTFGALNGRMTDERMDFEGEWVSEARRYYCNIVGKYGAPVQGLLKKIAALEVNAVCPLHGPVLKKNVESALALYDVWSRYGWESEGVLILYASMYGNTERLAEEFASILEERGVRTRMYDLSRVDLSEAVAQSFRFRNIALFAPTYNGGLYPKVEAYLADIRALGLKNRRWMIGENGSWAPVAGKQTEKILSELPASEVLAPVVTLASRCGEEQIALLGQLADQIG